MTEKLTENRFSKSNYWLKNQIIVIHIGSYESWGFKFWNWKDDLDPGIPVLVCDGMGFLFNLPRPNSKGVNFSNYHPLRHADWRKFENDTTRIPSVFTQHAIFSPEIEKLYAKNETYSFTILRGMTRDENHYFI